MDQSEAKILTSVRIDDAEGLRGGGVELGAAVVREVIVQRRGWGARLAHLIRLVE